MSSLTVSDLRPIDLFSELSDDELERWAQVAELEEYPAGAVIAEQGASANRFVLVLEGTVDTALIEGGRSEPSGEHVGPTWMGAIPVLTESNFNVRLSAQTDVRLAVVEAEDFIELVLSQRPVHRRVMRQVRPVFGRFAAAQQNRERLETLGKMAAGLAHELNNPAAAARRAADDLIDALDVVVGAIGTFVDAGMERAEAHELVLLQREALARVADATPLAGLDAADAEDEVLDALDELGIADAWKLAEPLASAGVDRAWLERVAELAGPATGTALAWVSASVAARGIAGQLCESTDRMSRLVGAVKSYAYMDRGDVVEVDLHEGLETTLTVLGHKLKHTHIEVRREYDRTLPRLTVRGSELNQVWTNLLANAIEALGDAGTITISSRRDGTDAVVEIADDGPGMPSDVVKRVFDPFFTTKPVGDGTGLGLDTARRIVQERHRGALSVSSQPGATAFSVRLPLEATAR